MAFQSNLRGQSLFLSERFFQLLSGGSLSFDSSQRLRTDF